MLRITNHFARRIYSALFLYSTKLGPDGNPDRDLERILDRGDAPEAVERWLSADDGQIDLPELLNALEVGLNDGHDNTELLDALTTALRNPYGASRFDRESIALLRKLALPKAEYDKLVSGLANGHACSLCHKVLRSNETVSAQFNGIDWEIYCTRCNLPRYVACPTPDCPGVVSVGKVGEKCLDCQARKKEEEKKPNLADFVAAEIGREVFPPRNFGNVVRGNNR